MAEDDGNGGSAALLALGQTSDIKSTVYEGGFKSWECSFDLVRLLLDRGPRRDLDDLYRVDHVIEVCLLHREWDTFDMLVGIAGMRNFAPHTPPFSICPCRTDPDLHHRDRLQCVCSAFGDST